MNPSTKLALEDFTGILEGGFEGGWGDGDGQRELLGVAYVLGEGVGGDADQDAAVNSDLCGHAFDGGCICGGECYVPGLHIIAVRLTISKS